ncbi:30S ribosomal protein S17e [archaeon]|jgi:ribosomal protein S17E|nr:30S ribosomal protein S17e [archaeon]MBT4241787.1 30S ribosomal protein S17e [archaeon]MBT4418335.1 30S ribosomal protein S17e [archaeon]
MGRIKSKLVKRTSNQLLNEENKFTGKFEENKKILSNTMPSKKIRNQIAGFIARINKRKANEKTA